MIDDVLAALGDALVRPVDVVVVHRELHTRTLVMMRLVRETLKSLEIISVYFITSPYASLMFCLITNQTFWVKTINTWDIL